jgi:hypothetical protein
LKIISDSSSIVRHYAESTPLALVAAIDAATKVRHLITPTEIEVRTVMPK